MLKLNEAQRTSLTVELRKLTRMCDEIERLLAATATARLVRIENDLTAQERSEIARQITDLRRQVDVLAAQWDLDAEVVNVRRHLIGMLSIEWVDLTDVRPGALRRNGPVDPDAAAELRQVVDELIVRVERLLSLSKGSAWRVTPSPKTKKGIE
ncbi:MAG: hypothetical protein DCC55_00415 [Chloroflexi bacterium]|nr:MAG: hypothetical protein DCC55_00415 [Chloroflexota bacterium]